MMSRSRRYRSRRAYNNHLRLVVSPTWLLLSAFRPQLASPNNLKSQISDLKSQIKKAGPATTQDRPTKQNSHMNSFYSRALTHSTQPSKSTSTVSCQSLISLAFPSPTSTVHHFFDQYSYLSGQSLLDSLF